MASFTAFADLSLHAIGEEGLLLDRMHQRLYALNASALLICRLRKDGRSATEIGRSLHDQFAVPTDTAAGFVADILRQYETLRRDSRPLAPETAATEAELCLAVVPVADGQPVVETYSLLSRVFRVHYASARLARDIHPLLQHRALANATTVTAAIDVVVAS